MISVHVTRLVVIPSASIILVATVLFVHSVYTQDEPMIFIAAIEQSKVVRIAVLVVL